jgi:glycosyltransferase involved in cell wall biosynthesis
VVATTAAAAGLADDAATALLRADDPAEMALAIEGLAHDPDQREALIEAGRRVLATRHDPAAIGARWLDVYQRAVRSGRVATTHPV